jgi:predicted RNA-binding Zn-ribbon protein involved in translation (DUF1610 family)
MKEKKYCLNCGKEISGREKRNNLFCNVACYLENKKEKKKEKIKEWLEKNKNCSVGIDGNLSTTIREHLMEINNYKCELCGWGEKNKFTNKIPLEIHHKDGNHTNNKKENLQVLCPNCHSLTKTHKGANKSTRTFRCNKELREIEMLKNKKPKKEKIATIKIESKNPGKEKLLELLKNNNINQTAKSLMVSYNCVVKWLKKYELPYKKEELNEFLGKETKQKKIRKKINLLTKDQLEKIRTNKEQKTYTELSKEFNTNRFTISRVINNKRYKNK